MNNTEFFRNLVSSSYRSRQIAATPPNGGFNSDPDSRIGQPENWPNRHLGEPTI
jgi:hypothetical protein